VSAAVGGLAARDAGDERPLSAERPRGVAARRPGREPDELTAWLRGPRERGQGRQRLANLLLRRLAARAAVRRVILENLQAEERLDADARKLLLDHAKEIRGSSADYRQLLGKVREKLARDRGFIL